MLGVDVHVYTENTCWKNLNTSNKIVFSFSLRTSGSKKLYTMTKLLGLKVRMVLTLKANGTWHFS